MLFCRFQRTFLYEGISLVGKRPDGSSAVPQKNIVRETPTQQTNFESASIASTARFPILAERHRVPNPVMPVGDDVHIAGERASREQF
jgi:hypothetical protein